MYPARRDQRIRQFLPVRVWGMDSGGHPVNQEASTVDISVHGARLSGVCCWRVPGEVVGLRYLSDKARYRIVWVGMPGSGLAGQIGLNCVEDKVIWGDALRAGATQKPATSPIPHAPTAEKPHVGPAIPYSAAQPAHPADHRRAIRLNCKGGARVQEVGKPAGQFATLADISIGGCYIETVSPLPPNTTIDVCLDMNGIRVESRAIVKIMHPNVGMGVEFRELRPEQRSKVQMMMASIQQQNAAKSGM
jgi:PilZ domain